MTGTLPAPAPVPVPVPGPDPLPLLAGSAAPVVASRPASISDCVLDGPDLPALTPVAAVTAPEAAGLALPAAPVFPGSLPLYCVVLVEQRLLSCDISFSKLALSSAPRDALQLSQLWMAS